MNENNELTGINRITVGGFKSIVKEQSIEIAPLTILAGANSSGKSSIMQPLLLLKQTLEAAFDPGPLWLNGPNVRFTRFEQMLSNSGSVGQGGIFSVGLGMYPKNDVLQLFFRRAASDLDVQMAYSHGAKAALLRKDMSQQGISAVLRALWPAGNYSRSESDESEWFVGRDRCFLEILLGPKGRMTDARVKFTLHNDLAGSLRNVIHLPGLRGNPERAWPVTAVGDVFPGTFEAYSASVIAQWQTGRKEAHIEQLSADLNTMGLTWAVAATRINDTQVELRVGRLPRPSKGNGQDLVNIADVGFGVSQVLPVLVALHVAKPGQLVYLEQPEIHLHPRAQVAMASILADAAKRGVRVVAETHSSLLLLAIQTLVAEGNLDKELVKLHWFTRGEDGATTVSTADLDERGAFGNWPEDFGEVELEAESRFLDATESNRGKA